MNEVRLEYNEARGTWNVFVNGEWYFETNNYEQAEEVWTSFFWNDDDE